jgi:AcrR family transcriptional regulator
MTAESAPSEARRSRGDRQREAILNAVHELLREKPLSVLSVSTISDRAGVARTGFYFYFDSKDSVLAQMLAEAMQELEELTHYFAPRGADESTAAFAKRMVGSAAAVFATNDPIMAACTAAQATDKQIAAIMNDFEDLVIAKIVGVVEDEVRKGTRPISDDIPALVRMLTATTAMTLSHDAAFVGRGTDPDRAIGVLERLWLSALWGTAASWED